MIDAANDKRPKPAEKIVDLIETRARESYRSARRNTRSIKRWASAFAATSANADNPYAADYVRMWTKAKYKRRAIHRPQSALRGERIA